MIVDVLGESLIEASGPAVMLKELLVSPVSPLAEAARV